jgi:hypothetical protein
LRKRKSVTQRAGVTFSEEDDFEVGQILAVAQREEVADDQYLDHFSKLGNGQ